VLAEQALGIDDSLAILEDGAVVIMIDVLLEPYMEEGVLVSSR
jgi:hypothetical protein